MYTFRTIVEEKMTEIRAGNFGATAIMMDFTSWLVSSVDILKENSRYGLWIQRSALVGFGFGPGDLKFVRRRVRRSLDHWVSSSRRVVVWEKNNYAENALLLSFRLLSCFSKKALFISPPRSITDYYVHPNCLLLLLVVGCC